MLSAQIIGSIQFSNLALLVGYNPTIDSLTLDIKTALDRDDWAIFATLPNLRKLYLTSFYTDLDDTVLITILSRCPRLESFRLECSHARYIKPTSDTSSMIATCLPQRLALRDIVFFGHFLWDFVLSLLPLCPSLTKITIPLLDAISLDRLCQILEENKCPQLTILDFSRFHNGQSEIFARIIHSCRHLALKDVRLVWGFTGRDTLEALWQHHGPSLEALRVTKCMDNVTSQDLAAVVAACPRLKVLHLRNWSGNTALMARDIVSTVSGGAIGAWPKTGWSCYNLVELRVTIAGICTTPQSGCPVHEDCQTLQREVYRLFSRLTHLRVLDVGCRSSIARVDLRQKGGLEWTLASGMGQLHTLRGLEELSARHMENGVGVPELEWMKEHWPRLNCVEGLITGRVKENEVETWLRERWPTLSWS
ncbi:hypothetical protein DFQ26_000351 [Actinomortierella ambigua]|nr:hypothetical protein DFQ26_000351 [Actinomortierella ambigua]